MTPDPLSREEMQPDDGKSDATRRIHPGVEEPIETTKLEQPKGLMTSLREAYARARDGRRQQSAEKQPRTAQTVDRSKGPAGLSRSGSHHDIRVSGDVLEFEHDERPLRRQEQTQSRPTGDASRD